MSKEMAADADLNKKHPSRAFGWMDVIQEIGEREKRRLAEENAFLDRVVEQLDRADPKWWWRFADGPAVGFCISIDGTLEEKKDQEREIRHLKRKAIKDHWIFVAAAVQAGIVAPVEGEKK